jgi:YbbR domain-containing protein
MSDGLRSWGLRLLALGIALALWFSISLEDRQELSERVVEASISYDWPRNIVILDPQSSVRVRVRGSSKQVRELNPYLVNVQVELTTTEPGTHTINLSPEDVLLPGDLEVVSIEPNTIRVDLEREVSQRVPVIPQLVGKPPAGVVVEEAEVFPNLVLVSGPESMLAKIESLRTQPISLEGHSLSFQEEVPVESPDPLVQIVQPPRVLVNIPIRQPGSDDDPSPDQDQNQDQEP